MHTDYQYQVKSMPRKKERLNSHVCTSPFEEITNKQTTLGWISRHFKLQAQDSEQFIHPVSYTHLTLPTKLEV